MQEIITVGELAQLAIVGAFVSVLVQWIKAASMQSPTMLRLIVIVLSLLAGVAFYLWRDTSFWTASIAVVGFANTVFLFLIKPAEEAKLIRK